MQALLIITVLLLNNGWSAFEHAMRKSGNKLSSAKNYHIACENVQILNGYDTIQTTEYNVYKQEAYYVVKMEAIERIYDMERELALTIDHRQKQVVFKTIPFKQLQQLQQQYSGKYSIEDIKPLYEQVIAEHAGNKELYTLVPKQKDLYQKMIYSFESGFLVEQEIFQTQQGDLYRSITQFETELGGNRADIEESLKVIKKIAKTGKLPATLISYEYHNYYTK